MTHTNNVPWTEQDLADMRQLRFVDRLPIREIGKRYGVSRERIRQLIGNTGHSIIPNIYDKLNSIPNANTLSADELAEKLGYPKSYVQNKISGLQHYKLVKILVDKGLTVTKIKNKHLQGFFWVNNHLVRISYSSATNKTNLKIKSPQHHFQIRGGIRPEFFIFHNYKTNNTFVIPEWEVPNGTKEVYFCFPTMRPEINRYIKYLNRFDLLV